MANTPVERKFYDQLLDALGLDPATVPDQLDRESWPGLRLQFADIFRTKTRDEWCRVMEGRDACFAPVLSIREAVDHPHMRARQSFVDIDGVLQPVPAPRFSRTPSSVRSAPPVPGSDTAQVLSAWGFSEAEIADLRSSQTIT